MLLLVKILIVGCLAMIFWEDMRSRLVHWFWFPLLVTGFIILRYSVEESLPEIAFSSAASLGFIALQLLLVSLYFSFKAKRWVDITTSLLGWGDVLLLMSIAFYFALPSFLLFYVLSLLVILIGWLIYQRFAKRPATLIPLAGLQAVILLFTLTMQWWRPDWMLFDAAAWMKGLTS